MVKKRQNIVNVVCEQPLKFFRSVRKFVMVSVVQVTGYGHLQGLIGAKSKHQFLFFRTLALHIALSVLANILGVL